MSTEADSPTAGGPGLALLSARGISKRYPGVVALDAVDFELQPGEVHAVMGQNGAGKSTLIKILTGAAQADGGSVRLEGRAFAAGSPAEAQRAGVVAVYQEINLAPTLSVAENICLGRQPMRWWGVDWGAMRRQAREALRPLGVEIDVDRTLGMLPVALQQLVAIARALSMKARVLILDEPTSSLDAQETERLFEIVGKLKRQGLGIIFITHFLDQVYRVADRITVLRNGRRVHTGRAEEISKADLVSLMLGSAAEEVGEGKRAEVAGEAVLEVRELGAARVMRPVSFSLKQGEVLGFAGLLGSGRTELAELIFGARAAGSGTVRVGGREVRRGNPRRAIAAGVGLSPEDRKRDGLFLGMSVRDNIAIVAQRGMSRWGLVSRRRHRRLAETFVSQLQIGADAGRAAGTLSGGNQQKALLARWLAVRPRVLILDEPTRGVDVGARAQIEQIVSNLAAGGAGMGVIFISAEMEEIVRRCTRVLIFRDRGVIGEAAGAELSQERILAAISA